LLPLAGADAPPRAARPSGGSSWRRVESRSGAVV
jgi:hypothetical protein